MNAKTNTSETQLPANYACHLTETSGKDQPNS